MAKVQIAFNINDQTAAPLRGVESGLERVGEKARSMGGVVQIAMGSFASAVAQQGLQILKDRVVDLYNTVREGEPIHNVRQAFEAFAGDVEGGSDAMLLALQKASDGTVTNSELMASFNKANQLVGEQFAHMLPDAMGPLGKVAASTGEDVGFLLDSLVVGIGRLSPMILDNLGIQVNLNDAYTAYAEKIGKSVDQLSQEEKQAALTAEVVKKLGKNTADLPTPDAAFQQLSTIFGNMREEIGLRLLPVFRPFIQAFINSQKQAGLWLDRLAPLLDVIQRFGEKILETGNIVTAGKEVFGGWFDTLLAAIDFVVDLVQSRINTLRSIISVVLPAITGFWKENGEKILSTAKTVWETIDGTIQNALQAIGGGVMTTASSISTFWSENGAAILLTAQTVWDNVQVAVQTAIEFVSNLVKTVSAGIATYWSENGATMLTTAETTWGKVQAAVQTAIEFVSNLVKTSSEGLRVFWETYGGQITRIAEKTWTAIKLAVETTIIAIGQLFGVPLENIKIVWDQGFLQVLLSAASTTFEIIKGVVTTVLTTIALVVGAFVLAAKALWDTDLMQGLVSTADGAFQFILDIIETALDTLISVLTFFKDLFSGNWSALGGDLRDIWDTTLSGIVTLLSSLWSLIQPVLQSLWDSIKTWWDGIDWGALGKAVVDGIINELAAGRDAIVGYVMSIAQGAIDAILNAVRGRGSDPSSGAQSGSEFSQSSVTPSIPSRISSADPSFSSSSNSVQRGRLDVGVDVSDSRLQDAISFAIIAAVQEEMRRQGQRIEIGL